MRIANGRVVRHDCLLVFRSPSGDSVVFQDDPREGDNMIFYTYLGAAGAGFDLVRISYYEGGTYMLVGPTGIGGYIAGPPSFSPDSMRFISVSMDLEADYEPNVLQVWRIDGQRPYLELGLESEEWGPSDPRWEGNDVLSFMQNFPTDSLNTYRKVPARLIRGTSGWGLSVPP